MTITALDPTGGTSGERRDRRLAPRPTTLRGQHLGLVVNGLGNSEQFLDALADELTALGELDGVIKVVKSSVSIPPEAGDWSRLTDGATVAITGFGG